MLLGIIFSSSEVPITIGTKEGATDPQLHPLGLPVLQIGLILYFPEDLEGKDYITYKDSLIFYNISQILSRA